MKRQPKPLIDRLLGKRTLVGVYPDVRHPYDEDANGVGIEFHDVSAIFYRDPNDGYRSSCQVPLIMDGSLYSVFGSLCGTQLSALVQVKKVETDTRSVIEVYDSNNKKLILTVGTEAIDDYYPYYSFEWRPENLSVNYRTKN